MDNFWAQRIYTESGFVKDNILQGKKALDVGCGPRKLPGAVGMDLRAERGVDIVHDADITPWPIENDLFDLVFFNQSLEHMENVARTLEESFRVLRKDGRVVIQVPYFRSVDAYADTTHKHFFTSRALEYIPDFKFRVLGFWYGWPHDSSNPVRRFFKKFIHQFPDFYDAHLSKISAVECLTWELEVRK